MNHLSTRCGCGAIFTQPNLKARNTRCEACVAKAARATPSCDHYWAEGSRCVGSGDRTAPCEVCLRCKATRGRPAVTRQPVTRQWFDMGDAPEVQGSAAIDFGTADGTSVKVSADKWEQIARDFTAEKAADALCKFAAEMATPVEDESSAVDALRYIGIDPGYGDRGVTTVTHIDTERGVITFDGSLSGGGICWDDETFRLGARGCHVGAKVRHRDKHFPDVMRVTTIDGSHDRVWVVDDRGHRRAFVLSSGVLLLVDGSGR